MITARTKIRNRKSKAPATRSNGTLLQLMYFPPLCHFYENRHGQVHTLASEAERRKGCGGAHVHAYKHVCVFSLWPSDIASNNRLIILPHES